MTQIKRKFSAGVKGMKRSIRTTVPPSPTWLARPASSIRPPRRSATATTDPSPAPAPGGRRRTSPDQPAAVLPEPVLPVAEGGAGHHVPGGAHGWAAHDRVARARAGRSLMARRGRRRGHRARRDLRVPLDDQRLPVRPRPRRHTAERDRLVVANGHHPLVDPHCRELAVRAGDPRPAVDLVTAAGARPARASAPSVS